MNKKKIAIIAITVIVAVGAIIAGIYYHNNNKTTPSVSQSDNVIKKGNLPSMTKKEIENAKKAKKDPSAFSVQVEPIGKISKDSKVLKLGVGNPFNNVDHCTVQIMENNKVLFTSKDMAPQTYMNEIPLSQKLSSGDHNITVRYNVYINKNKIGSMDVKTKVVSS